MSGVCQRRWCQQPAPARRGRRQVMTVHPTEQAGNGDGVSMDFQLSAEHQELRRTLRAFFEKEAPHELIMELDRNEQYPAELYAKMAAIGLCGITVPEEYGGNPADEIALCIAVSYTHLTLPTIYPV